ncbi:sugar phosphate isomerase/epimerase [Phocaeicola coprophilus]|nr:sugar phosphate isomerase/epimerase [Phocaeicola coprophilus]
MKRLIAPFVFLLLMLVILPVETFAQRAEGERYKISVCDWMILKRQKIGEFALAREIGCDGIEVDMGGLGKRDTFDNKLRYPHFQKLFREKAQENKVEISSIAMSGFYGQSILARDNYVDLVQDCLNTMKAMDVKTAFLPLGPCDLAKNPEIRPELVRRMKVIGDMAAREGRIIGIETSLDAQGDVELLKEIGSKGIKIYFKFQNALEAGRDVSTELKILGRDNLCDLIHCTDTDGVTLDKNTRLDMKKIKATLDSMGWSGWLVIERSRDASDVHNVKKNYGTNAAYLKSIFQD